MVGFPVVQALAEAGLLGRLGRRRVPVPQKQALSWGGVGGHLALLILGLECWEGKTEGPSGQRMGCGAWSPPRALRPVPCGREPVGRTLWAGHADCWAEVPSPCPRQPSPGLAGPAEVGVLSGGRSGRSEAAPVSPAAGLRGQQTQDRAVHPGRAGSRESTGTAHRGALCAPHCPGRGVYTAARTPQADHAGLRDSPSRGPVTALQAANGA